MSSQIHTFLAASVADAVTQIRETLGPTAVVLNVRRLPAEGLARLWQKPRIEVLAHVPPAPVAAAPAPGPDEVQVSALAELRAEMQTLRDNLIKPAVPPPAAPLSPANLSFPAFPSGASSADDLGDWRIGDWLKQTGLLPVYAERVVAELCGQHGGAAPIGIVEELELAQQVLAARWRPAPTTATGMHVFLGAPGVGKTTALCQWLAQSVLVAGRSAAVWRLDGHVANTAESLSVFGEILGVPVERFAPVNGERPDAEVLLVDLPGVNPLDAVALESLAQRLAAWPDAQVHLVVNGAYEATLLLTQIRAFARLPLTDVVVTHLDEEPRWGKVWNLVLGTSCPVRWLSAGQNVPGDFRVATAAEIFSRQFPSKIKVLSATAFQND